MVFVEFENLKEFWTNKLLQKFGELILKIMQTLALENYGAVEMNIDDQSDIDGGFFPAVWGIMIAIDIGLMAVYATYDAAGKLKHNHK